MQIGLDEAYALHRADESAARRKTIILAVIFILLFWALMQFGGGFLYARDYDAWWQMLIPDVTTTQVQRLLVTAACGVMLALAGNIFQCVFRNPMAAPTMLGISSGVQLAVLILIMQIGGGILSFPLLRIRNCYIGGAAMFAAVLVLGKITSGPGKLLVEDMLLIGIALSGVVGTLVSGYVAGMDIMDHAAYIKAMNVAILPTDTISMLALAAVFAVCVVPLWLMRFSFNTLSYTSEESASMGVNPVGNRAIVLFFATLMVVAAMVHGGTIGMAALIVPHISRFLFGAESRKQFMGNALLGAILLLVCRQAADMLPWMNGDPFPLGTVVNIAAAPAFAIAMGFVKKGWE